MSDILFFPHDKQLEYIYLTDYCIACEEDIVNTYYELPVRVGNTVTIKAICYDCHHNFLKGKS